MLVIDMERKVPFNQDAICDICCQVKGSFNFDGDFICSKCWEEFLIEEDDYDDMG